MDRPTTSLAPRDAASSRLLTVVGIVVVIAGLYFGRQVLIPLALAMVLAFLLTPVVRWLEKWHLGRVPSVGVVLVVCLALASITALGVATRLMDIMVHVPDYRANIHQNIEALRTPASGSLGKASTTVNDLSKELTAASDAEGAKQSAKSGQKAPLAVQVAAPPRSTTQYLRDVLGPLSGVLEAAAIVVIFTLFILVKREDLRNRLLRLAGSSQLNIMTQALDEASNRLGRYLLLQAGVNAGYGLLFGFGVYFIGIPHALLRGLVAGLLRFVPYIGSPAAAIFPMVMAVAVFPGWSRAGLVFALFLFLEVTVSNFIEPWLYGAHTGISSLAILVMAIFWGMLWGPVGLILSTPLTVCLVLLGRYVPQLSFFYVVLGDEPVLSPEAHFYQRLLALDDEEAREIAERYLKANPVGSFYDSVLIPALGLAEQDRHRNSLDDSRIEFIHRTTREMIEEFYEVANTDSTDPSAIARAPIVSNIRIVCIPARDEADELAGQMLSQLLVQSGYDAHPLPVGPVSNVLEQVDQLRPNVICVSGLPPFAAAHARSLCRRLRQRYPKLKLILGLWQFPGGVAKAQEKAGIGCADIISTSLEQTVLLIARTDEFPLPSEKMELKTHSS